MEAKLCFVVIVVLVLGIGGVASAEYIEMECRECVIAPQSPLPIELVVSLSSASGDRVSALDINESSLRFRIQDDSRETISYDVYPEWTCPIGESTPDLLFWSHQGEIQHHRVLVNRWCSTNLPPGNYLLIAELSSIAIDIKQDSVLEAYRFSPPKRWEFPVTITAPDPDAVRGAYQAAMRSSKDRSLGRKARQAALERVAFSREPLALETQLEMYVNQQLDEFVGWDSCSVSMELSMYFIEKPRIEVARAIAGWLQAHPETDWYGDMILWTAFEMRDKGGDSIAELLAPALEGREKPRDPRLLPGPD